MKEIQAAKKQPSRTPSTISFIFQTCGRKSSGEGVHHWKGECCLLVDRLSCGPDGRFLVPFLCYAPVRRRKPLGREIIIACAALISHPRVFPSWQVTFVFNTKGRHLPAGERQDRVRQGSVSSVGRFLQLDKRSTDESFPSWTFFPFPSLRPVGQEENGKAGRMWKRLTIVSFSIVKLFPTADSSFLSAARKGRWNISSVDILFLVFSFVCRRKHH